jgi:hypothetical protein
MARYRVELSQTIIENAIVYVEANNQQEAEDLALGGMVGAGVGAPCTVRLQRLIRGFWKASSPRLLLPL